MYRKYPKKYTGIEEIPLILISFFFFAKGMQIIVFTKYCNLAARRFVEVLLLPSNSICQV